MFLSFWIKIRVVLLYSKRFLNIFFKSTASNNRHIQTSKKLTSAAALPRVIIGSNTSRSSGTKTGLERTAETEKMIKLRLLCWLVPRRLLSVLVKSKCPLGHPTVKLLHIGAWRRQKGTVVKSLKKLKIRWLDEWLMINSFFGLKKIGKDRVSLLDILCDLRYYYNLFSKDRIL